MSRKRSKSKRKSRRLKKSCKSKKEHVKRVKVFYNDVDSNYIYTYKRKTPANVSGKVIKALKKSMKGFCNLKVTHMKDNVYSIASRGPDSKTSNEARNLSQLGEVSDFAVKLMSGNYFWPK